VLGNHAKGVSFGLILGVIVVTTLAPYVFWAYMHPGFLLLRLGVKPLIAILLWHLIYGLHLGAIYNPLPQSEAADEPAHVREHESASSGALVVGEAST
jgi:hypothetical protein